MIRDAASNLKPFKAPGPDGVPNVVLKKSIEAIIHHLYFIFRAILELRVYPESWKHFTTVVLRKPRKPDYSVPKAYRPIALMNTTAKLFTSLLANFLSHLCESRNLLPANQFGGRPGRMTTDSLHLLTYKVKEAWRNGKVASALFLDVQGAFPNVVKEVLLHNMRLRGVPTVCTDIIDLMLTGRSTRLSFDDYISEIINIVNGNNQGCPLSMILYAFYNCPLIEIAKQPSKKELVLGFVDDVGLLAIGHDFTETHHTLREMMERPGGAFEWSWTHNSPFELTKLAIVDFTLRKHKAANLPLFCRNSGKATTVEAKNIYRFLGVLLEPNLKWSAQTEGALATATRWVNLVRRIAKTASGLSSKALRQLYLAVAQPIQLLIYY
jgi:hypothetical protein